MKRNDKKSRTSLLITTALAGLSTVLLTGCISSGSKLADSSDNVQLNQGNYTVVKANAIGTSRGFKLLGLIPLNRASYAAAKKDLYKSVDGKIDGRSIALSNQSEEKSSLYLILFSVPKITISADVIEFDSPAPAQPAVAPPAATNTTETPTAPEQVEPAP